MTLHWRSCALYSASIPILRVAKLSCACCLSVYEGSQHPHGGPEISSDYPYPRHWKPCCSKWEPHRALSVPGVYLSKDLMAIAGHALKANITTLAPLVLPVSEQLLFFMNLVARKVRLTVLCSPMCRQGFKHPQSLHRNCRGTVTTFWKSTFTPEGSDRAMA